MGISLCLSLSSSLSVGLLLAFCSLKSPVGKVAQNMAFLANKSFLNKQKKKMISRIISRMSILLLMIVVIIIIVVVVLDYLPPPAALLFLGPVSCLCCVHHDGRCGPIPAFPPQLFDPRQPPSLGLCSKFSKCKISETCVKNEHKPDIVRRDGGSLSAEDAAYR